MNRSRCWMVHAGLVCLAIFPVISCRKDSPTPNRPVTSAPASPTSGQISQSPSATQYRTLLVPAVLRADEMVDVYAKTSGYAAEVSVDIGSRVRRGDLLLTISVPEVMAQLASAEAVLTSHRARSLQTRSLVDAARAERSRWAAESELQRTTAKRKEDLFNRQAIPQQEWDEARSRLEVSQAQLKSAEAKAASADAEIQVADSDVKMSEAKCAEIRALLDYSRISAPFDGVITRRMVDPGTFVRSAAQGATTPLLTVAKTHPLRLVLDIPEQDSARIQVGDEVEFRVKSMGDRKFNAKISRTSQGLRSDTRTMQAEADVENADNRFLPGTYAQAAVRIRPDAPPDRSYSATGPTSRNSPG